MQLTNKQTILIKIFIILILIGLIITFYYNKSQLSCDKCTIKFKNEAIRGRLLEKPEIIPIKMLDLYQELKQDKCIIRWSEEDGFR